MRATTEGVDPGLRAGGRILEAPEARQAERGRAAFYELDHMLGIAGLIVAHPELGAAMLRLDRQNESFRGRNGNVSMEHEAKVSKISEEQLYYLMSRGIPEEKATEMIVMGFVEPFTKELPMEYAVELNRLINYQMEGSVG